MAEHPSHVGFRAAHEVLEDAIRANHRLGAVCLGLAICLALVGAVVVSVGAIRGNGMVAVAGFALAGVAWPARLYAKRARGTNTILRALEAPLSMDDSPSEIAQALPAIYGSFGGLLEETNWFIRPKHTLGSVVGELSKGLKNGTIVLDRPE